MKILVATPAAGGLVHWKYTNALLPELFNAPERLNNLARYDIAHLLAGGYSGLGKDRDIMASTALRMGFDKLLFIDADQSWKWEQIKKIVESPHPITAGMVPLKSHPIQLNFTTEPQDSHFFDEEAGIVSPRGIDRWRAANPGQDYLKVSAAGTAFLCIDVNKVLRPLASQGKADAFLYKETDGRDGSRMVKCWDFFPSGAIENNYYGEDYGFCILAQRAGFPIHVDTSIEIPHYGQYEYNCAQGREEPWSQLYLRFKKK